MVCPRATPAISTTMAIEVFQPNPADSSNKCNLALERRVTGLLTECHSMVAKTLRYLDLNGGFVNSPNWWLRQLTGGFPAAILQQPFLGRWAVRDIHVMHWGASIPTLNMPNMCTSWKRCLTLLRSSLLSCWNPHSFCNIMSQSREWWIKSLIQAHLASLLPCRGNPF